MRFFFFAFLVEAALNFTLHALDSAQMYANDLTEMRAAGTTRPPFFFRSFVC